MAPLDQAAQDRAAREPLDAALAGGAARTPAEGAAEEPAAGIAGAPATRIPVAPPDDAARVPLEVVPAMVTEERSAKL